MKNKEFYHTNVELKEYPFDIISLKEITTELIQNIKKFNSSKDINEKIQLSKQIPIEFPKCRFCGNSIINSNFFIDLKQNKKTIQLIHPEIYCREIDGNKYYLSCCEKCLLGHFKDNLPKSQKYYFMKANKYGQYSYGYSDDEYKKICSMTVGVTEMAMINKWGYELGKIKWKEYCDKQAIKNTFEYKKEKYNWDKEKFDLFNKTRAVTKENLINKYGENLGIQYYNDYVNKQKLTKSYNYMIKKFGKKKTDEINKSKALTYNNFIRKYGEQQGLIKFNEYLNKNTSFYSNISQKFFNELDKILGQKYKTYYASKNTEYGVMLLNKQYIKLDYFIEDLNLCIEFNGDCFHANPKKYKENDTPNPFNKELSAKEIWISDQKRYEMLQKVRNINTIIVWESEYNEGINIQDFIKNKLKINI